MLVALIVVSSKSELFGEFKIDFLCTMNRNKLTAVNLTVEKPSSMIETVKNQNGILHKKNINEILIDHQHVNFLPINLGVHFKSLKRLIINHSELQVIDSKAFANMTNLQILKLNSNKLKNITSNSFKDLQKLQNLHLSYNKIEKLEVNAFNGLTNLSELKLHHNFLSKIALETFSDLPQLKFLFLNDNRLEVISGNISSLKFLKTADFSNNICVNGRHPPKKLKELDDHFIKICTVPNEILCIGEDNQIDNNTEICIAQNVSIINPTTKIKLENVVGAKILMLSFSDQTMLFMPMNLAQIFPKLHTLQVQRSELTKLDKTDFQGLNLLETIIIESNNFSRIDGNAFDDIPKIKHLSLSSNNIKKLPAELLTNLTNLKHLILSNNQLQTFTANLLPSNNVIEELHLQKNQLEVIDVKIFHVLKQIKFIDLTDNTCINMEYTKSTNNSQEFLAIAGAVSLYCGNN